MSPQHVKVCRQKWRQLRCSAVGRSKNLGWEKKNYENWIVLLLVLPNPEEAAPATPRIRQPWDGMSLCKNILCFGMVKGVCSWFGQKLGIFLWRNKKLHFGKSALFSTLHSEHDYLLSKCIIFQWRDIMIIDIIKRIKFSNVAHCLGRIYYAWKMRALNGQWFHI